MSRVGGIHVGEMNEMKMNCELDFSLCIVRRLSIRPNDSTPEQPPLTLLFSEALLLYPDT
jgi:hypothetical protein